MQTLSFFHDRTVYMYYVVVQCGGRTELGLFPGQSGNNYCPSAPEIASVTTERGSCCARKQKVISASSMQAPGTSTLQGKRGWP